jgi:hypothetical protein
MRGSTRRATVPRVDTDAPAQPATADSETTAARQKKTDAASRAVIGGPAT